jgi:hypothetical protein
MSSDKGLLVESQRPLLRDSVAKWEDRVAIISVPCCARPVSIRRWLGRTVAWSLTIWHRRRGSRDWAVEGYRKNGLVNDCHQKKLAGRGREMKARRSDFSLHSQKK